MKQKVIDFAGKQYHEIDHNKELSAQQRLYQFSMPLLAVATLHDKEKYSEILNKMDNILKNSEDEIPKNWQLWMLGRMLLAAKLQDDTDRLNQYKNQLSEQLLINNEKDPITGWAYAYLALADQESYLQNQQKLFDYAELARNSYEEDKKNASNYIWTLVMNLFASAHAKNQSDYQYYLTMLRSLSNSASLKEVVSLVPEDDYRQWLVSVTRYAFQLMKDQECLNELPPTEVEDIKSMDTMLAWANELRSQLLNQTKSYNPNHFYSSSAKNGNLDVINGVYKDNFNTF